MSMRRSVYALVGCLLLGLLSPWASAEIINGQYVPPELVGQYGTQYRLVFVTSGVISGSSAVASTYDNFLLAQVAGTQLEGDIYGWKAVVSTFSGDRIASSVVNDTGLNPMAPFAGVYNMAGIKVDHSGGSMLDGSLLSPVQFDQNGVDKGNVFVWTGSNAQGGAKTFQNGPYPNIPATLGSVYMTAGTGTYSSIGSGVANDGNWLDHTVINRFVTAYTGFNSLEVTAAIYGISDVLIVPVPEPATLGMWLTVTALGGVLLWRKRQRHA